MTDLVPLAGLAVAVGIALLLGLVGLLVLGGASSMREKVLPLWPLMWSEVGVAAAVVATFILGLGAVKVALVLVSGRIGYESAKVAFVSLDEKEAKSIALIVTCCAVVIVSAFAALVPTGAFLVAVIAASATGLFVYLRFRPNRCAGSNLLALLLYPGVPIVAFSAVLDSRHNLQPLLLAFLLSEIFDSTAVLGGRLFGRTPLAPRLSPRKTVEGLLVGSIVLVVACWGLSVAGLSRASAPVTALTIAVATVCGDLAASAAKRRAGVKDYPAVIRVQGGLLDLLDGWIVSGPALVLVTAMTS